MRHYNRKRLLQLLAVNKAKELELKDKSFFLIESERVSQQLNSLFARHDKAVTFIGPLTSLMTYPMIIVCSLILLVKFSLLVLSIISLAAVSLAVPTAVIAFIKVKREREKIQTKSIETIALLQIKLKGIRHVLMNSEYAHLLSQADLSNDSSYASNSVKKNKWLHVYNGIETSILAVYTLFCTYYLSINAMIYVVGRFVSEAAVIGPVGLLSSLGVCLLAGVYFGFNQYQSSRQEGFCKARIRELNKALSADEKIFNASFSHTSNQNLFQLQREDISSKRAIVKNNQYDTRHQFSRFFTRVRAQPESNESERLCL